jgi:hypothetical protein
METMKQLISKSYKPLSYFLKQSKNPAMLLRYARHYILTMAINESFLKNDICNDDVMLFPDFRLKIICMLDYYKKDHVADIPAFFETYRSNSRQYSLYSSGASKVKSFGMHYFGLAVDLVNYKNGLIKWSLDYKALLKIGNDIGLTNLTPFELCHFQFIPVSMQNDFRSFVNNLTKVIQDLLNCKIDGSLGPITQGAILFDVERLKDYFDSIDVEKL